MLKRKKIVIIDGYNVLRNSRRYVDFVGESPNFKDWTADLLNAAREALLNDVAQMIDKQSEAIIVYDAARRKDAPDCFSRQVVANIQVLFTNYGESADERIQFLARQTRNKLYEVKVVTNDFAIQDTVMNDNVTRMSAREFQNFAEEIEPYSDKQRGPKDAKITHEKIENIVDNETADKLLNLRNSL